MLPRKKAVNPGAACRKLKALIKKYGCEAEIVGMGFVDFEKNRTKFIAVINLFGNIADMMAFQEFICRENYGKINRFPVKFFERVTIH